MVSARARDSIGFPLTVSSLLGDLIQGSLPAVSLDESFARLAGVYAPNRFQGALDQRIVVRGAGARSPFGTRGVVVLLDGVPQTLPDGQTQLSHVDPAGLATAQVLRGPAAAFYGNGAGGVILLTSPSPVATDPSSVARVVVGSHGSVAMRLGGRARLGSGAVSVEASRTSSQGFRDYSAQEQRHATLGVAQPLGHDWLATLRLRGSWLTRAENPGALDSAQLEADPRQASLRNVAFRAGKTVEQVQASLELRRGGEAGEIAAVLFAVDREIDNPLASAWVLLDRSDYGLRLLMRRRVQGTAELSAGLDVQLQRDERLNFDNDSGQIGAVPRLDQQELVAAAGARLAVAGGGPRTRMLLGVRTDVTRFRVRDRLPADGDGSGTRAMSATTASFGVSRQLPRGWRLRAGVGESFETPTTTELALPTGGLSDSLSPQRTRQLEVGLERGAAVVRVSLAAYASITRAAIVPREDSAAPGRFRYRNVGRIRSRGFEATVTWHPRAPLSVAGSLSWSRHRYGGIADSAELNGRRVPGVPEFTAWSEVTVGAARHLALELVMTGPVAADDANLRVADGYALVHARGAWPLGRALLLGGVRNLLNREWVASVTVNGAGGRVYEPGPGRTWYLGMRVENRSALRPRYLYRYVILPLVRSYGDNSTATRSPWRILM